MTETAIIMLCIAVFIVNASAGASVWATVLCTIAILVAIAAIGNSNNIRRR